MAAVAGASAARDRRAGAGASAAGGRRGGRGRFSGRRSQGRSRGASHSTWASGGGGWVAAVDAGVGRFTPPAADRRAPRSGPAHSATRRRRAWPCRLAHDNHAQRGRARFDSSCRRVVHVPRPAGAVRAGEHLHNLTTEASGRGLVGARMPHMQFLTRIGVTARNVRLCMVRRAAERRRPGNPPPPAHSQVPAVRRATTAAGRNSPATPARTPTPAGAGDTARAASRRARCRARTRTRSSPSRAGRRCCAEA